MTNIYQRAAALTVLGLLLSACATLGFEAKTFNERAVVALSSVTAAANSVDSLLASDTITADDAENIVEQIETLKAGIDVARVVHSTNPAAGDERLTQILAGLEALSAYLRSRNP